MSGANESFVDWLNIKRFWDFWQFHVSLCKQPTVRTEFIYSLDALKWQLKQWHEFLILNALNLWCMCNGD